MDIYFAVPFFSAQHGLNQSQQFPFRGDRLGDSTLQTKAVLFIFSGDVVVIKHLTVILARKKTLLHLPVFYNFS
jgi:hypothetical protein